MPPSPDRPASACWVFRVTHAKWRDMLTLEANGKFSQGRPGPRRKKKPSHRAGTWDVKWKGRAPHWRGSVLTLTWAVSTMRTTDTHAYACHLCPSTAGYYWYIPAAPALACPPGPTPVLANQLPVCQTNVWWRLHRAFMGSRACLQSLSKRQTAGSTGKASGAISSTAS
jgi:hypothetical protein